MNTYLERYAYPVKLFSDSPNEAIKISIVIPCHNEPDILSSLISLNDCKPVAGIEVIIIVNESDNCKDEVRQQNLTTLREIDSWKDTTKLNFSLLTHHLISPEKTAGVGLARKVGMDEAARRFEQIKKRNGVICCFDADSTCSPNYLESVSRHFIMNKPMPHGAAVYFEHVMPEDKGQRAGIIQYELHLRYYVHALRLIGYPYAHQTVGSSMIVRSDIYQKIGGMNKRKAGEDFYFLHRLMPTGSFIDIKDAIIYPSARISDRVPFGTGKAMAKWQDEEPAAYHTYSLQSFLDLQKLLSKVEKYYQADIIETEALLNKIPESIKQFLLTNDFTQTLVRINKQSNNLSTFIDKWYQYFDGFKILKYIHYARENYYPDKPVAEEALSLAHLSWPETNISEASAEALLTFFRQKDRLD